MGKPFFLCTLPAGSGVSRKSRFVLYCFKVMAGPFPSLEKANDMPRNLPTPSKSQSEAHALRRCPFEVAYEEKSKRQTSSQSGPAGLEGLSEVRPGVDPREGLYGQGERRGRDRAALASCQVSQSDSLSEGLPRSWRSYR